MAQKSDHKAHKIGAVLIRKNKIIALGFNKQKTSPLSPHAYKAIHAETDAIITAVRNKEDFKNTELYVFRATKDGVPALSFPCSSCLTFIQQLPIRKVHYTSHGSFRTFKLS